MSRFTLKAAIAAGAIAVASTAFADASNYAGPKMDFSKVQPEFRIGFLGDEAAQDMHRRVTRA